MVVQHNLRAMNSNRMLGITSGILSKSAEKLSSGYKVNRAADDAAGLSISEKMRKQIRGLTQATMNAEDGISSVQTAEGALTEVHDMLQRMNELANKASNGTNSVSDRQTIQDEVDQLLTEIDRVSETTKFNEIYLLKGNAEGAESSKLVNAHDAGIKGTLVDKGGNTASFELKKALADGDKITIAGTEYTIDSGKGASSKLATLLNADDMNTETTGYGNYVTGASDLDDYFGGTNALKAGMSFSAGGKEFNVVDNVAVSEITFAKDDTFKIGNLQYKINTTSGDGTEAGTETDPKILSSDDAIAAIKDALGKGEQVFATKFKGIDETGAAAAAPTTTETLVVLNREKNEVTTVGQTDTTKDFASLAQKALKVPGNGGAFKTYKVQAGDTYTIDGVTTTAATNPVSAKNVYDQITKMTADGTGTVTIGTGSSAVKYTIVADTEDEDAASYKLHANTILSKIRDGEIVTVSEKPTNTTMTEDKAYTVIGDIGKDVVPGAVQATITAEDAYAKIADALKQASSIGTDVGSEATVKDNGNGSFTITKGSAVTIDALSFNLHVGADADMTNKISVNIDTMDTKGLGIQKLDVIGRDANGDKIDDGGMAATYAIDSISDAIAKVSAQRSLLGAVQNRLDHTINNLENVVENTTAAESQIRDTDMATEMVKFSNTNILAQAGQSMLAQANQANQGVLSLLG